jgi:GMP synthase (glutamine-hydrolysing)
MRFLVLQNDAVVPLGNFGMAASHHGHAVYVVSLFDGEQIPDVAGFDGVVLLGGGMGSYDEESHPYLVDEKSFVADVVERGVPVLGICLGCQLLADALGGRAYHSGAPEVEFKKLTATVVGDRVMDALVSGRVLSLHEDTFDVPEGATVTATSDRFTHAFRHGSALAVQSHPEVTPATLCEWTRDPSVGIIAEQAGVNQEDLVAEVSGAEAEIEATALAFFGAWFDEVEERTSGSPLG